MYVYLVPAWCPWGLEEGVGNPGAGVIDGCDLPWA